MKCPCGVDHWHWAAAGFQGVVSMLSALKTAEIPPSAAAVDKLKEQLAKLEELIHSLKAEP